jgi:TrmH family RNA methyltransferase
VVEGFHALKHALRFGAQLEQLVAADPEELERLAERLAPDLRGAFRRLAQPVPAAAMNAITEHPTHAAAIARRPDVDPGAVLADARPSPLVLLEDPHHLGNVGAVVRVAAAAGAAGVLTTGTADPWDPAALRGSAGLHFALPVAQVDDLAVLDRPLIALDPGGDELDPARLPERVLLAFGTERHGLSAGLLERADERLRIPMRPGVSSLNLATAVAAVLFAWRLGPAS